MLSFARDQLAALLTKSRATSRLLWLYRLQKPTGLLAETGWIESAFRRSSVAPNGSPKPWLTYSAIDFLDERLERHHSIFEYGSGQSTLWLSQRVSSMVSCEHEPAWHESLSPLLPSHVVYLLRARSPQPAYSDSILESGDRFDLVLIDGRDRVRCAARAATCLTSGGVIVWDDAERPRYQEGLNDLVRHGFRRLDFKGLAPLRTWASITAVFYREGNCLGI